MMFQYLFPQELAVDMRIDFGGGNLFMSQHLLDSKQVGSPFQQVGGEGMAERMRLTFFLIPAISVCCLMI